MFVNRKTEFPQRMTKFLQLRLEEVKVKYGEDSPQYRSLESIFMIIPLLKLMVFPGIS